MTKKWPHMDELYYDTLTGEFAVVDCMGETLTFFTGEHDSKRVADTYMFIAGCERVL